MAISVTELLQKTKEFLSGISEEGYYQLVASVICACGLIILVAVACGYSW